MIVVVYIYEKMRCVVNIFHEKVNKFVRIRDAREGRAERRRDLRQVKP